MIFLIHGQETFLSHQNLSDIKKRFLEKNPDGYNLSVFSDPFAYSISDIKNSLKSISLFSAKIKLLIIQDFFQSKSPAEKEMLIDFLSARGSKGSKIEHIIIFETKNISDDHLYNKLKETSNEKVCEPLSSIQLQKWLASKFIKENIAISLENARIFLGIIGRDLRRIDGEAEKIISWLKNKDIAEFSSEHICLLEEQQFETNIFKTIESAVKKNVSDALRLLINHLESGEKELYLLAMYARQFRIMLKINTAGNLVPINDLAKKLKMHPFALKKSAALAQYFTLDELKKHYGEIVCIEESIKKGANGREKLLQFVINISQ